MISQTRLHHEHRHFKKMEENFMTDRITSNDLCWGIEILKVFSEEEKAENEGVW